MGCSVAACSAVSHLSHSSVDEAQLSRMRAPDPGPRAESRVPTIHREKTRYDWRRENLRPASVPD